MNLEKDKLKALFKISTDQNIRFEQLNELFDDIDKINAEIKGNKLLIDNEQVKKKDVTSLSTSYFGLEQNSLIRKDGFNGDLAIAENFYSKESKQKQLVLDIGAMLGGFDFETHRMFDKYRIISNAVNQYDDYSQSLSSNVQEGDPSSHFAGNNYYFNIMYFIKNLKNCEECEKVFDNVKIILRYPGEQYFKVDNDDEKFSKEYQKQKEVLKYRFPPKFLWMWANRDKVIHLFSLMAFRNLLNTHYGEELIKRVNKNYTPEHITNMKFDDFTKIWKDISDQILQDLNLDSSAENISNVSKIISIIMTEEADVNNGFDLLGRRKKPMDGEGWWSKLLKL